MKYFTKYLSVLIDHTVQLLIMFCVCIADYAVAWREMKPTC